MLIPDLATVYHEQTDPANVTQRGKHAAARQGEPGDIHRDTGALFRPDGFPDPF